jgi:hypothetical protein
LGLRDAVDQDVVQYAFLAASARSEKDLWERRRLPPRPIIGHANFPGPMKDLWCKTCDLNPEICISDITLDGVVAEKPIRNQISDANSADSDEEVREMLRVIEMNECARVD